MTMMSKNRTLIRTLCAAYCTYYKPGKNEELLCRGAVLIDRFIGAGRPVVPVKTGTRPDQETTNLIVRKMCASCDFHEHDCDFMENNSAPPCGGFVLLSQLVMSGQIQIDELT